MSLSICSSHQVIHHSFSVLSIYSAQNHPSIYLSTLYFPIHLFHSARIVSFNLIHPSTSSFSIHPVQLPGHPSLYSPVISLSCSSVLLTKSLIHPSLRPPQVFQFFISRVREKLHIVLCMSPVGDAFRSRCRMFPSLVNCCTIDWFVQVSTANLHKSCLLSSPRRAQCLQ